MTEPIDVAAVLEGGAAVLLQLKGQLHEQSATAKRAESDAFEALGAFERSVALLTYETKRQATVAASRKAAAAERDAADKAKAIETERQRHIRTLERSAQMKKQIKAAEEYERRVSASK